MMPLIFLVLVLSLFPADCWSEDRLVLQQASQHIEKGDLEKAEIILRSFLKQHDRDAYAYYLLGVALSGLGKRQESNSYLQKALKLDNTLGVALRYLGVNAFDNGDVEGAKKYLEARLKQAPGDEAAHFVLAQIALDRNDFPLAVKHFRQSPNLVWANARLQLQLAQALVGADQIEEGKNTALSIRSDDPVVLFEVGVLLTKAKHYKEAIERFQKARLAYPDPSAVDFNMALTYFQMGDTQTAVSLLNEMIEGKRAEADVYGLLGDAYRQLGRMRDASSSLQKAVSLAPEEEQYHIDLLALCIELEEIEPGLEAAKLALQRHPDNYELYGQRAMLYSLKNLPQQAEADYRKALELSPKTEWLYTSLATVLSFDDDRLEEAKTLLESHLEEFKGYYSYYLYSEVLRHLGLDRYGALQQKARGLLEKAVSLSPNFAPARLNLGRIYVAQQDWSNAILQLQAAVTADPGDRKPYYVLSQVYLSIGNQEKAQEILAIVGKLSNDEVSKTPRDNVAERIQALKRATLSGREK